MNSQIETPVETPETGGQRDDAAPRARDLDGRAGRRRAAARSGARRVIVHAQGLLEWLARQTSFSYLYWMVAALIAGLCKQLEFAEGV